MRIARLKIAHLILAHKSPAQLGRLLDALAHPDADCYIHLDQKADFGEFAFLQSRPRVYFCHHRCRVSWGGYSLTEAVLTGSREILSQSTNYDFLNVLSGQDYPLQAAEEIQRYLHQHRGQSFVEYEPPHSAWWRANANRLTHYHLTDFDFPGRYLVQRLLNAALPRRRSPLPGPLYGGPMGGWYTLSRAAAGYAVRFMATRPHLRRFVRLTWGSDEFLLPTILLNSPLRATIVNDNLRYIDWSGGGANPRILTSADLPALRASPKLWARKFDLDTDAGVLDQLDQVRQPVAASPPLAWHSR